MASPSLTGGKQAVQHGSQIFVYSNLRTNQVIYSLSRSMNNTSSIKQLPFLGKKTVPAALRKDLWLPLCLLSFPRPSQGLSAYRCLREFRKLHETNYPRALVADPDRPTTHLLPRKAKGRILMDQKANSVADMAAVLFRQARPPTEAETKHAMWLTRRDGRPVAKRGFGSRESSEVLEWRGNVEGVRVSWADLRDAEYAERWPEPVQHTELGRSRYTAAWPPLLEGEIGDGVVEEGEGAKGVATAV